MISACLYHDDDYGRTDGLSVSAEYQGSAHWLVTLFLVAIEIAAPDCPDFLSLELTTFPRQTEGVRGVKAFSR